MAIDDDAAEELVDIAALPAHPQPETAESWATDLADDGDTVGNTGDDVNDDKDEDDDHVVPWPRRFSLSPVRAATLVGLVAAVTLAALVGWLGISRYQTDKTQAQRELFLEVGRQGAINLTTIDYQHVEADVQRIIDSSTGNFYDDFKQRSAPFIDVVKKAQAKSVGTVTAAGLESESGNEAQVLVAVSVKTTNAGAAEPTPRAWRMRIAVSKLGADAKVSNVAFVP